MHEGWNGYTMLGNRCEYLQRGSRVALTGLALAAAGDLVTMCTASAVWRVVRTEGTVAVLVAAGMTPGDNWKAGNEYRVHFAHLQHAPQHDANDLFAGLVPGGSADAPAGQGAPMA